MSWWPGNVDGRRHPRPPPRLGDLRDDDLRATSACVHQPGSPWWEIVTVFFAIGMGLALDEFALWLELKDVYWEKDGRKSIDAMILAAAARRASCWSASAPGSTLADRGRGRGVRRRRGLRAGRHHRRARQRWRRRSSGGRSSSLIFWPAGHRGAPSGSASRTRSGRGASIGDGRRQASRGSLRRCRRRRAARIRPTRAPPAGRFRAGGLIVAGRRPELVDRSTPSAAAVGIASSAPRMPASWAPASTAIDRDRRVAAGRRSCRRSAGSTRSWTCW